MAAMPYPGYEGPLPKKKAEAETNSAVDCMVSFRWSQEDVKRYAMEINSPILYQAVKSYEAGTCTWEAAMQVAAVTLAKHCAEITKQHIDLMQRQPAPMILKES